jgi:hypothetical protein
VVFAHGGLKVGSGQAVWMRLVGAPLHEQAIAHTAEGTHDDHAGRGADAAAVVIMRNIQTLVESVFNTTKTGSVKFEPLLGVEFLRVGAGEQGYVFIVAVLGLAQ